jgi:hypothetical protein
MSMMSTTTDEQSIKVITFIFEQESTITSDLSVKVQTNVTFVGDAFTDCRPSLLIFFLSSYFTVCSYNQFSLFILQIQMKSNVL